MLHHRTSEIPDVLIVSDDADYRILAELLIARGVSAVLADPSAVVAGDRALEADLVVLGGVVADASCPVYRAFNRCATARRTIAVLRSHDPDAVATLYRKGAAVVFVPPADYHHLCLQCAYFLERARSGDRPMRIANTVFDPASRQIRNAPDGDVRLTEAETRILVLLSDRAGQNVAKDEISEFVFRKPYDKYDRRIDVHISNIRRKLRDAGLPVRIDSSRLGGVRLVVGGPDAAADPEPLPALAAHEVRPGAADL